jgi:hypothetical protein
MNRCRATGTDWTDGRVSIHTGARFRGRVRRWGAFLVGLAASIGAGISMGFAEALSDDGSLTGRGRPLVRGTVCGAMTAAGGIGHTLPFLQQQQPALSGIFLLLYRWRHVLLLERAGLGIMPPLDLGQVVEQLSDGSIGDALRGPLVEPQGLEFHHFSLLADGVDAEWPDQPNGTPLNEPFYVVAPDERACGRCR